MLTVTEQDVVETAPAHATDVAGMISELRNEIMARCDAFESAVNVCLEKK